MDSSGDSDVWDKKLTIYFHIIENVKYSPPDFLDVISYVHIKGKPDREKTAIMTKTVYDYPGVTREEMKEIIDSWIEDENENAPIDEITGEPVYQSYINLDMMIKNYGE